MGAQCVSATNNELIDTSSTSTNIPDNDSLLANNLKFKTYRDYNANLEFIRGKINDAVIKIEFQNNFMRYENSNTILDDIHESYQSKLSVTNIDSLFYVCNYK